MTTIAVVDHGAGNLVSIAQGLAASGARPVVVDTPGDLSGCDGIVLPGVGSAAAAYERLAASGFVDALRHGEVPLLGICVGLQVLFDGSEEDDAGGLGLIPGRVRRLVGAPRLPHIGWNDLDVVGADPLLEGIPTGTPFYFVHSYAPVPDDPGTVLATAEHGSQFVAAARLGRVSGVQFHPERSGATGLRLLANFVSECRGVSRAA